ncbi:distal tail protein Dit [Lysinibacillus sp. NPDC097162]|uniref:distal tail protein Dit n=1 Tax=Lysinibacillus sp. NPDC097162 TaxID=3364140 RepID=UPI0037F61F19
MNVCWKVRNLSYVKKQILRKLHVKFMSNSNVIERGNSMSDITFKGIHCSRLGLEVMDTERPLFGEFSDSYIKLPKVNGSIVISDNSESDIEIRIQFLLTPLAGKTYYDACRALRGYFKSAQKEHLIFDEDSKYAYMAKFISSEDFERIVNEGLFWATFRCSPDMVAL